MTCHDCGSTLDADEARDWLGYCPGCWWCWRDDRDRGLDASDRGIRDALAAVVRFFTGGPGR